MKVAYFRILRIKYHLSLDEVSAIAGLSNQQLSRIELGVVPPSAYHEQLLRESVMTLIARRRQNLHDLKSDCNAHKGHLLDFTEECEHGI